MDIVLKTPNKKSVPKVDLQNYNSTTPDNTTNAARRSSKNQVIAGKAEKTYLPDSVMREILNKNSSHSSANYFN